MAGIKPFPLATSNYSLATKAAAVMIMCLGSGAFAGDNVAPTERVGDIVIFEGERYVVYAVDADGMVYTMPESGMKARDACPHRTLEVYGEVQSPFAKIYNDKTNCYQSRMIYYSRCLNCNQAGFITYGKWDKEPHDFPLIFGNQCNNTVNGVRCTSTK